MAMVPRGGWCGSRNRQRSLARTANRQDGEPRARIARVMVLAALPTHPITLRQSTWPAWWVRYRPPRARLFCACSLGILSPGQISAVGQFLPVCASSLAETSSWRPPRQSGVDEWSSRSRTIGIWRMDGRRASNSFRQWPSYCLLASKYHLLRVSGAARCTEASCP
ncbi:hypothetical protein F5Y01DRAFT_168782 [Xylaria sp. FL0043]|nr:hypothetical protein F5Y01DRAFT_168782 [Xylaria sp. FL0043]